MDIGLKIKDKQKFTDFIDKLSENVVYLSLAFLIFAITWTSLDLINRADLSNEMTVALFIGIGFNMLFGLLFWCTYRHIVNIEDSLGRIADKYTEGK